MAGKIFLNYRRDDDPNGAARVRDGLAAKFGKAGVFMDVDNLLAGQRFDRELAKALAQCDVLIAILGPRWIEQFNARAASGERDYVREEIAEALKRNLVVVPVRVGREGQLQVLPRPQDLPEDIRDLVLYQKHDVSHERFGRDIAELIGAITTVRGTHRSQVATPRVPLGWIGVVAASVLAVSYVAAYYAGAPVWMPRQTATGESSRKDAAADAKGIADRLTAAESKLEAERQGRADAEARAKELVDAADKAKREQEAREEAARKTAQDVAKAEIERQLVEAVAPKGAEGQPGQTEKKKNAARPVGCTPFGKGANSPVTVGIGSELCSENANRATIHEITSYSITYSVDGGQRVTCKTWEICTFAWSQAPTFKVRIAKDTVGAPPAADIVPN